MAEQEDERIDALLRDYLSQRLDGQLGRATSAFAQHLRATSASGSSPRRPRGGWVAGIAGAALAASIAGLWAGPSFWNTNNSNSGRPVPAETAALLSTDATPFDVEQTLISQTVDNGTVCVDGRTPARMISRRQLTQTLWVDERLGVRATEHVPRKDVFLIQLDTY